jgi:hypothetical protein
MGKKELAALFLFFVVSFTFAQEQFRGRFLIMGWSFVDEDTSIQTNIAIDAIINYAAAARLQMSSEEEYNPSCKIELYRVNRDNFYNGGSFETSRIYIYVNINNTTDSLTYDSNIVIFGGEDYHDRYIEIDFYIIHNEIPSKYKLVLYYNDYNWIKSNKGNNQYELISRDDGAFNFFISEVEKLKR